MIREIHIHSVYSLRDFSSLYYLIERFGHVAAQIIPRTIAERDHADTEGELDDSSFSTFVVFQLDDVIHYFVDTDGFTCRTVPPREIAVYIAVHVCKMCELYPKAALRYTHVYTQFDEENSSRIKAFIRDLSSKLEIPCSIKQSNPPSAPESLELWREICYHMENIAMNTYSSSKEKSYDMDSVRYGLREILEEIQKDVDSYNFGRIINEVPDFDSYELTNEDDPYDNHGDRE